MHLYLVFCHPSNRSFASAVLEQFTEGLSAAGHTYEIGDLYAMGFQAAMDQEHYVRETRFDPSLPVPADVALEQEKIRRSAGLVLIYPVWWSDCPALLKGWFDRVWTLGFAYLSENGSHEAGKIAVRKALVICTAGHPVEHLEAIGIAPAMRTIMLNDRLLGIGIPEAQMEILGGTSLPDPEQRQKNLQRAFELGKNF